jgi:hypothetical protein
MDVLTRGISAGLAAIEIFHFLSDAANAARAAEAAARREAEQPAAVDDDAGEDADAGADADGEMQEDGRVSDSTWTFFFTKLPATENAPAQYQCRLHPETVGGNTQTHKKFIKASGGSSNLRRHMRSHFHLEAMKKFDEKIGAPQFMSHEHAANEVVEEETTKFADRKLAFSGTKRRRSDNGDVAASQLMRELTFVCFMINKGLSFRSSEDPYLASFISMSKQQALPSRKRIADTLLPLMYELVVAKRGELLRQVDFFSITTDGWTSAAQSQFVAITVHFILPNWQHHSMLLDLVPLNESHTWQNLTTAVALRVQNLLPDTATLVCTVTDNGYFSNIVAASSSSVNAFILGRTSSSSPHRCIRI